MKKYLLVIAVVVSIVGLIWFSKRSEKVLLEADQKSSTEAEAKSKNAVNLKAAPAKAIAKSQLDPAPQTKAPNEAECRSFQEKIASTSREDLLAELEAGKFNANPECRAFEDSNNNLVKTFYDFCAKKPVNAKSCSSVLALYRARAIDMLTGSQTDYMNMDISILMNKIMNRYTVGGPYTNPPAPVVQMAEAVLARYPDNMNAYRMLGAALLMNGIMDHPDRLANLAQQGMVLNPEESDMHEFYLSTLAKKKDIEGVNAFVTQHPNSAPALYFQALALARTGDLESPIALLEKAKEIDPKGDRYQKALEEIKKGNTKVPGTSGVSFNFNLD